MPSSFAESDLSPPDPSPTAAPDPAGGLFGRYTFLLVADVGSRGLRFLADLSLARHFGQAIFGQLNVAQSLAVQGMGLASCGLDTAGMRDIAANPAATSTIAASVVLLRLLLGLVTWGALALLSWVVPQYRETLALTALYGLSLFTGALTLGWVAQGRGRTHVVGAAILATHGVYFGGVQLAIHYGWPPATVPALLVLTELLTAAALWIWVVRKLGPVQRPLPWPALFRFLRSTLPIGGANVVRGLTVGSDVLLLGLFLDKADVGFYSGAFKLYALGLSVVALYLTVLLPELARRATESVPAVRIALHTALKRSLFTAVPLSLPALFLARPVMHLLFPSAFDAATGALQILLVALPLHLASGHFRIALIALGRQRQDLALVTAGAIVHIAAKLLLIPFLGLSGAALGTFAGEAVLLVVSWRVAESALRDKESATHDLSDDDRSK